MDISADLHELSKPTLDSVYKKITLRMIPFLFICYFSVPRYLEWVVTSSKRGQLHVELTGQ